MSKFFAHMFTSDTEASWNSEGTIEAGLDKFRTALYSTQALVFFTSDRNTFTDQVGVGRDFYQFVLALTKHGAFSHPLTQAVQEYPAMARVRERLDRLRGSRPPEKLQMIVRVGRSDRPFYAYRRLLKSFVVA